MLDRFLYSAIAVGISGHIDQPFPQIIPAQGSLALPDTGGFATTRVEQFCIPGIISFRAISSMVSGSSDDKKRPGGSWDTVATVTVEGLNILDVVTADRIVARVASSYPKTAPAERTLTPMGSYYENLRVAGCPVKVTLALDMFHKYPSIGKLRAVYKDDKDFRDHFNKLALIGDTSIPKDLLPYFPYANWKMDEEKREMPQTHGIVSGSLVNKIRGLPDFCHPVGHIVAIERFGKIRFAEFKIKDSALYVNMLKVDLGCTPSGSADVAYASTNGSEW